MNYNNNDYLELAEHAAFRSKTHEDIKTILGSVPFDDGVDAWQRILKDYTRLQDLANDCHITIKHHTLSYALVSITHPTFSSLQGFATVTYPAPGVLDFWHNCYTLSITDVVFKGFYRHTAEFMATIQPYLQQRIERTVMEQVPYPAGTLFTHYQLTPRDIERGMILPNTMTVFGHVFQGRSHTVVNWTMPEAISLSIPQLIDAMAAEQPVDLGAVTLTYPPSWGRSIGYMRSCHREVTPDNLLAILMGAHR